MKDFTVDARGRACPEPVIMTKQAIDAKGSGTLTILVDTTVARDNVGKLARKMGFAVSVKANYPDWTITIHK